MRTPDAGGRASSPASCGRSPRSGERRVAGPALWRRVPLADSSGGRPRARRRQSSRDRVRVGSRSHRGPRSSGVGLIERGVAVVDDFWSVGGQGSRSRVAATTASSRPDRTRGRPTRIRRRIAFASRCPRCLATSSCSSTGTAPAQSSRAGRSPVPDARTTSGTRRVVRKGPHSQMVAKHLSPSSGSRLSCATAGEARSAHTRPN